MMPRALKQFTVSHETIRLRVKVYSHAKDIYALLNNGAKWRASYAELPHGAFIASRSSAARFIGTILLSGNQDLNDDVPHEVAHAVVHFYGGISATTDEPAAYAIGRLTSKILKKVRRHVTN